MSTSPIGYLWHWSSGKVVCPRKKKDGTYDDLIFANDIGDDYQFKFVDVRGAGHFGYIEHVKSHQVVLPKDTPRGTSNNSDSRAPQSLIIQSHRHAGALFGFDEDDMFILHKSGKIWCSEGENPNPSLASGKQAIVLTSNQNDAAKFYFGDKDGNPISPYPKPDLSGDWNLLRAFITPLADHTYNQTYKIGRTKTETDMSQHGWSVSAGFAMGLFSANANYSGAVQGTSSETWSEEKEESYTISVTGSKSVFVWQYTFSISQYGEEVKFLSSIIGDTDDVNKKPSFITAAGTTAGTTAGTAAK